MTINRRVVAALLAVCSFAFVLRVVAARTMPNQVWPDEIFQSLEQAHRLVFGYGIVPWEFREGARSWLLPGMLAPVMALTERLGPGSSGYLWGVASFLSALSLAPVVVAFLAGRRRAGLAGGVVAGVAAAVWFELVFFAAKALAEVVAAHALVAGLYLAERGREEPASGRWATAGVLLGLACCLRVHLLPAALPAAAWLAWRAPGGARLRLAAGFAAPVAGAGLLDLATWGVPFGSYWENVRRNLVEGKGDTFGTAPWTAYFRVLAGVWSLAGVALVAAAVAGARRRPGFAIAAVATVVVHSALAHKEYRFLYPAIACIVVMAAEGTALAVRAVADRLASRGGSSLAPAVAAGAAWCAASIALAGPFSPSVTNLTPMRQEAVTHWEQWSGYLGGMEHLSRDPGVCGVAFNVYSCFTGGYAFLHHDVPVFEVRKDAADIARVAPAANAVLAQRTATALFAGFAIERCWPDDVCALRRPGTCAPVPGYDFNEVLRLRGD
jgi:hypothetical protein